MLHMVVLTHGPDTCAAVQPEAGEMARTARNQLEDTARKLGAVVQSWWIDPPAHVFYIVVDAPNAHVVNSLMIELKLFLWNTVDIHPIITADEAMPLVAG